MIKADYIFKMYVAIGVCFFILIVVYVTYNFTTISRNLSPIKVGVLLYGNCNDNGYGQSHCDALRFIEFNYQNIELQIEENTNASNLPQKISNIIKNNNDVIIGTSIAHSDVLYSLAESYERTIFYSINGKKSRFNLASVSVRNSSLRYLTGLIAGKYTNSNFIGYVATRPLRHVIKEINAFTLGVKESNPDAKVYVYWTKDFNSREKAEQAARILTENYGVDVITSCVSNDAPYVFAENQGIYSIAYGQAGMTEVKYKKMLASIEWHWENFYKKQLIGNAFGNFRGGMITLGPEHNVATLNLTYDDFDEETKKMIYEKYMSLPNEDMHIFEGPLWDNLGHMKIGRMEIMPDHRIDDKMDWLVSGVEEINER